MGSKTARHKEILTNWSKTKCAANRQYAIGHAPLRAELYKRRLIRIINKNSSPSIRQRTGKKLICMREALNVSHLNAHRRHCSRRAPLLSHRCSCRGCACNVDDQCKEVQFFGLFRIYCIFGRTWKQRFRLCFSACLAVFLFFKHIQKCRM